MMLSGKNCTKAPQNLLNAMQHGIPLKAKEDEMDVTIHWQDADLSSAKAVNKFPVELETPTV